MTGDEKGTCVSAICLINTRSYKQEESQDHSTYQSLVVACQLEANRHRQTPFFIGETTRAQCKCTGRTRLESESFLVHLMSFTTEKSRFHPVEGTYSNSTGDIEGLKKNILFKAQLQ